MTVCGSDFTVECPLSTQKSRTRDEELQFSTPEPSVAAAEDIFYTLDKETPGAEAEKREEFHEVQVQFAF